MIYFLIVVKVGGTTRSTGRSRLLLLGIADVAGKYYVRARRFGSTRVMADSFSAQGLSRAPGRREDVRCRPSNRVSSRSALIEGRGASGDHVRARAAATLFSFRAYSPQRDPSAGCSRLARLISATRGRVVGHAAYSDSAPTSRIAGKERAASPRGWSRRPSTPRSSAHHELPVLRGADDAVW